ncbi:MAG: hypothetical protein K2O18_18410 [Oscillospiraceae bacterium]|nr:hypothetical protein [Oscillospiraceae bacterium]
MEKKQYDVEQKNRADNRMLLRVLVCAYLLYLACQLVSQAGSDPALPAAVCWLTGGLFAAAAVAFGLYSWRQYRISLKDAELSSEEEGQEGR